MADPVPPARPEPEQLPLLWLRSTVVFPMSVTPLVVVHPAAIASVNRALAADRRIALAWQSGNEDGPDPDSIKRVGTLGVIRQMARGQLGLQVLVEGTARVHLDEIHLDTDSLVATVRPYPESNEARSVEIDAHMRRLRELLDRAFSASTGLSPELRALVVSIDDPLRLAYLLASLLDMKPADKQLLLEENSLSVKLNAISSAVAREVELLEIKGEIESRAQKEMTDAQRQYFLRQQLKAIQTELGESEGQEMAELRKRVEDAKLPEPISKTIEKEIDRLERMQAASPEYQMIRTYIDWVLDIPWTKRTEDRLDPVEARRVLDEDHYDLDKVKERIVEYLAVRKLKGDMKGPILCFVGPPGVGKTSLGQSVARAMNRQFVRISLGGVRDEAEIRGHRRTYIGSMPGRIIQGLRQAGSTNPVFMLDEIDKMSIGFQGDPAAALLEVLDPAQNNTFRDHYLELPYNLSHVLFITTANQLGPVHPALLDRMEVISLSGYTEEEKIHIARRFLLPRQLSEHGLPPTALELTDAALRKVIMEYTREAGVRNLERQLGTIARKVAARLVGVPPPQKPEGTAGAAGGAAAAGAGSAKAGSAGAGSARAGSASAGSAGARAAGAVAAKSATSEAKSDTKSDTTSPRSDEATSASDGSPAPAPASAPAAPPASAPAPAQPGTPATVATTVVDVDTLHDYLGRPRFREETSFRTSRPGVATGVAWTETGGDVLFIEASLLPGGHGQIVLTGQLGNVMQESARAAVSHIRADAASLGIAPTFLENHDLHIHVPAGAIPKDGPSAGVTMATAIVSALRREPVNEDVAMTGEITLSGLVLPVGGIREKALAARRHGIRTFVLPAENEPDLEDVPADLRNDMAFVPVSTLDEVLRVALPATAKAETAQPTG
jgi:ATP-dependent Lon protease